MMFAKVIKSIKEIEKNAWDSIVPKDNIQMSYDYLKTIEESVIEYQYYYILIYSSGQIVASLPLFLNASFCLDTPLVGRLKEYCELIRNYLPFFLKTKVLFGGCPIAEYNSINMAEGVLNEAELFQLILGEVELIARQVRAKLVLFKDFPNLADDLRDLLIQSRFFAVHSLPSTCLEINIDSFEAYLQGLNKKHRHNIRNKINYCTKCRNIEFEVVNDFAAWSEKLYPLYENTYNKASVKLEKLQKDFLTRFAKNLKGNSCVIVAQKDNEVIGFVLLVNSLNCCINVRMGLDYRYAHEYHLYYMLLYQNISYAIQNNLQQLYLSQTTYRPKLELGAQLVPLKIYARRRNLLWNEIYRYLFGLLFKKYQILSTAPNPYEELKRLFPQYFNSRPEKERLAPNLSKKIGLPFIDLD